jgi:hypothetical protein
MIIIVYQTGFIPLRVLPHIRLNSFYENSLQKFFNDNGFDDLPRGRRKCAGG